MLCSMTDLPEGIVYIGAPGFEPGTSPTRTVRATRLRHAPRGLIIPERRMGRGEGGSATLDGEAVPFGIDGTQADPNPCSGPAGGDAGGRSGLPAGGLRRDLAAER